MSSASAALPAAAAAAALASPPPPPLQLLLRTKDQVHTQFFAAGAPVAGGGARALPATPPPSDVPVKTGFDASSGICPLSSDGRLVAVTSKDSVEVFDVSDPAAAPSLRATIAQAGVVCASFSPLGDMLLTWHRKKAEEGALRQCVWARATRARPCACAPPAWRSRHTPLTPPPPPTLSPPPPCQPTC